jgi:predicted nucleic acid-binding protein
MKKLLIDTNILLDLIAKREPFYNSAAILFSKAYKNEFELSVLSLSFANVNYILLKQMKPDESKLILRKLRLILKVLNLNERLIDLALNDTEFKDFEDALQYFSAIENNIDFIITRNLKDFQKSKIPIMTADQYLKMI